VDLSFAFDGELSLSFCFGWHFLCFCLSLLIFHKKYRVGVLTNITGFKFANVNADVVDFKFEIVKITLLFGPRIILIAIC
jgi:hypothetical protein